MAKKRLTVSIDTDLDKKVRDIQGGYIQKTNSNWNYSEVLQMLVEEGVSVLTQKRW